MELELELDPKLNSNQTHPNLDHYQFTRPSLVPLPPSPTLFPSSPLTLSWT